jgi:hypothetical protein
MLTLVFVVVAIIAIYQREVARRRIEVLTAERNIRAFYLDYICRQFSLHIRDPYVVRPGFSEKRCYYCWYPVEHDHAHDCPWKVVRPLTELLYALPVHSPAISSSSEPA